MNKSAYSKRGIVALCAVIYFTSYFSRKSFAASLFGMIEAGAILQSTAGLVETAMFICYGAGQLLSGFLGDKVKPSVLLGTGLGVTALCNLVLPFVPQGEWIIPIWALNGLAQAMLWPPIVRILATNLDHEQYVTAHLVYLAVAALGSCTRDHVDLARHESLGFLSVTKHYHRVRGVLGAHAAPVRERKVGERAKAGVRIVYVQHVLLIGSPKVCPSVRGHAEKTAFCGKMLDQRVKQGLGTALDLPYKAQRGVHENNAVAGNMQRFKL
jgi:hypothetical protein